MSKALSAILEAAKRYKASESELEEQRRSFAYGNTAFENKLITREMINQQAEKLAAATKDDERR